MRITVTPNQILALVESLGRITTGQRVLEDELTPEEVKAIAALFLPWEVGEVVLVNDLRRYGDHLYKCVQSHTTQGDWTPDVTPALWTIKSAPGIIPVWVQPTGAHDAYAIGDRVQWPEGGAVWESTIAANTTEPGTLLEHGYWVEVP